jgi:hypothetical protein
MIQLTDRTANGTSFHGTVIKTTVNELTKIIGEAQIIGNDGQDKVNFDWTCENSNGDIFTIYDWKEYRSISEDEIIEFHIGGESKSITEQSKEELLALLY